MIPYLKHVRSSCNNYFLSICWRLLLTPPPDLLYVTLELEKGEVLNSLPFVFCNFGTYNNILCIFKPYISWHSQRLLTLIVLQFCVHCAFLAVPCICFAETLCVCFPEVESKILFKNKILIEGKASVVHVVSSMPANLPIFLLPFSMPCSCPWFSWLSWWLVFQALCFAMRWVSMTCG